MAKVMLAGIDPALVDFSDPALPPGMTAQMISDGLVKAIAELEAQGHSVMQTFVPLDPAELGGFAAQLAGERVDCVVIGGGVTTPPQHRLLFEALLNIIARATPSPAIVLVSRPDEAATAIERVLR